jgi:cyclin-dependent kinase regulatory subunit CKS1
MNFPKEIEHSEKYYDEVYEYKHVILTKEVFEKLPRNRPLLNEEEWRALGVHQTKGWLHYTYFKPEPHILLFRRQKGTNPSTGKVEQIEENKV